jgi:hypothetical protein
MAGLDPAISFALATRSHWQRIADESGLPEQVRQ